MASFNPCFLGTCPRIGSAISGNSTGLLFQSLFSWNLPSDVDGVSRVEGETEFQSLFSWNLPSDRRRSSCTIPKTSFNPCFLGTCPRIFDSSFAKALIASFNPCFLGTCPRMQRRQDERRPTLAFSILVFVELSLGHKRFNRRSWRVISFNPCFRGTCPRTLIDSYHPSDALQFQSLFSWNLPSDYIPCMDLSKHESFNPCFRGTCPRTQQTHIFWFCTI